VSDCVQTVVNYLVQYFCLICSVLWPKWLKVTDTYTLLNVHTGAYL